MSPALPVAQAADSDRAWPETSSSWADMPGPGGNDSPAGEAPVSRPRRVGGDRALQPPESGAERQRRDGPGREDTATGRDRSIGSLLRSLRTRRLLTQEGLADLTGLSVRTIRHLESGRIGRPRPDTVRRLADGLEVPATERLLLEEALAGAAPTPAPVAEPPSTLPLSTPDFCGREPEAAEVIDALSQDDRAADGTPAICAVVGKPGVGKTALALHAAHRLRATGRFPGGQLYVNLLTSERSGRAGDEHP